MNKLKKLDSLLFYVTDTHKTAKFYSKLGFEIIKEQNNFTLARLKDFELHFHDKTEVTFRNESFIEPKGAGIFIYINVKNIDEYYQSLKERELKPSSKPFNWPWGNREFVIRDPDGYKLVFYEKIKKD